MNHTISLSRRWPASSLSHIAEALQGVARALRRRRAAWQQRREARDNHLALRGLDERTLRDLGIDRSEIGSLVAEFGNQAEPTRVRALRALRGLHM